MANNLEDEEIEAEEVEGLDVLLRGLESHCYSKAVVTVFGVEGETFSFDMTKEEDMVLYGQDLAHKALFSAKIMGAISRHPMTSIVIRSFLDEEHPETSHPYKELRGYRAWAEGNKIDFEMISAKELLESYTTDAETGETIEPEKEAIYCGPNEEIRGENL